MFRSLYVKAITGYEKLNLNLKMSTKSSLHKLSWILVLTALQNNYARKYIKQIL